MLHAENDGSILLQPDTIHQAMYNIPEELDV